MEILIISLVAILLQFLFKKPVVHVNQVQDLTYKTANELVTEFVNVRILKEMTWQHRNRIFVFDE